MSRASALSHLYDEKFEIPSLHMIGEKDSSAENSQKLADQFVNPVILRHSGGHTFPNGHSDEIVSFIRSL